MMRKLLIMLGAVAISVNFLHSMDFFGCKGEPRSERFSVNGVPVDRDAQEGERESREREERRKEELDRRRAMLWYGCKGQEIGGPDEENRPRYS